MKRSITVLLILLIGGSLFAFEKDEWKSKRKRGYFRGGAGGLDLYMLPLNVDDINSKLKDVIHIGQFSENIFLTGGGGWGYVGKSIRLGGMGCGGFTTTEGAPGTKKIQKEAILKLGFGGFLIEKAFHPFNNSEIYFGAMVGGGSATLNLVQWSGPLSWDQIWNGYRHDLNPDSTNNDFFNYKSKLKSDFFAVMPTIGFRYNIFRWCAIGGNVAYLYTHMDQEGWRTENRRITGVPEIDFSNIIYRFNVYFGG